MTGSSFAFQTIEDRWYRKGGEWRRDLIDVTLLEVSPTISRAYSASLAIVR